MSVKEEEERWRVCRETKKRGLLSLLIFFECLARTAFVSLDELSRKVVDNATAADGSDDYY